MSWARSPARRQGVGQVGQRQIVVCVHPVGQPAGGAAQFVGRGGRQREQQWRFCRDMFGCNGFGSRLGCLFQDGMDIGSRQPVGRDGGTSRVAAVADPRCGLLRHKEFGVDAGQVVGQLGEVQVPGNHAVLQREDRLHHPECSGGCLRMAEVGLHRRQGAGAVDAVDLSQAGVFDRVAHRGAGAVRLDHADRAGVHARGGQRRPVHRGLRALGRGGDVHGVTVLIGGRAAHHRQDPITVSERVVQPLEEQHDAALAAHEPVGRDVEGAAASGGRQHALGRPGGELARVQRQGGAAGQGEIAFTLVQASAGQVDGGQAGRTRGVHRQCGTVDAQSVGDAPGSQAEVAPGEAIGAFHGAGVGGQQLVVAVRQPDEHPGAGVGDTLLGETGVFHCLP